MSMGILLEVAKFLKNPSNRSKKDIDGNNLSAKRALLGKTQLQNPQKKMDLAQRTPIFLRNQPQRKIDPPLAKTIIFKPKASNMKF